MKDEQKLKALILMAAITASALVISNIVAVKLWDFFGIAVDGGVVIFPLTYILGDIMAEIYGKKLANWVVYTAFLINMMAVIVFLIVGLLPEYPGWGQQGAYKAILGFTPRIVAGSLTAYLVSGLTNNWVFFKIKQKTGTKNLWQRALGSSAVAKLVDTLIFETVAFFGVLKFGDFLRQATFAYIVSLVLETLMVPITYIIVKRMRKYAI